MTFIHCDPDVSVLKGSRAERRFVLYGHADHTPGIGSIGNRVRDSIARLKGPVPTVAFDFLSIALAVTAADEFVSRDNASHGFARDIALKIALAKPAIWQQEKTNLERILRFLSGDNWSLTLVPGGLTPPTKKEHGKFRQKTDINGVERICLFSGGLDSLIGAVDCLHQYPTKTLLVSRASPKDKQHQDILAHHLGAPKRLSVNDVPTRPRGPIPLWKKEDTTRSRSILFIALGVCVAAAAGEVNASRTKLLIPENGVIALNPPLTSRRRGALSTRTAHPAYLSSLQALLDTTGLNVEISNPYAFQTKGEMILNCHDTSKVRTLAELSVSCGKWKRADKQCGKCVPCLIRLAALHHATITERTNTYQYEDLMGVYREPKHRSDLIAVLSAIRSFDKSAHPKWVSASGPLPLDAKSRQSYLDVAERGLGELSAFLRSKGFTV